MGLNKEVEQATQANWVELMLKIIYYVNKLIWIGLGDTQEVIRLGTNSLKDLVWQNKTWDIKFE